MLKLKAEAQAFQGPGPSRLRIKVKALPHRCFSQLHQVWAVFWLSCEPVVFCSQNDVSAASEIVEQLYSRYRGVLGAVSFLQHRS